MSDTRVEVSDGEAQDGRLGRRTVLRGVAIGGVSMTALAACGSDDESDSNPGSYGGSGDSDNSDDDAPTDQTETPADDGGGNGGGEALGATSDVPVGGGVVYGDQQVVVTQPTEGEFLGFTAVCTHQGCTVAGVADGTINCDCHGSKFSIEDGSVAAGPATQPLASETVTVEGQQVMLG